MLNFSLLLLLMLQTPAAGQQPAVAQQVVVGFLNGQQILVQDPDFSGFIEGHNSDAILTYRQAHVHGEMPLKDISRIEFGPYKKGHPFSMVVTLRNGQTLQLESERRNYISLRGKTELGQVLIKHPDPLSAPAKLTTHPPNRKKDLTIQYLEIPAS